LTKPFQSIRRLIDRVGALVSSPPPPEKESPTLELPHAEAPAAEEERMDTHELEVTTADTLRLDEDQLAELQAKVEQPGEEIMENGRMEVADSRHDSHAEQSDVLLDLGEIETVGEADDDFVLELDDEVSDVAAGGYQSARAYEPAPSYESSPVYEATPAYEPAAAYEAAPARAFVEPQVTEAPPSYQPEIHDSFADTQEVNYAVAEPEAKVESVPAAVKSAAASVAVGELSPEMIDAIARRAVELMSDKVIREIAWEVVPDLAELLIKKQLEETK
jgi:hypothetical protein